MNTGIATFMIVIFSAFYQLEAKELTCQFRADALKNPSGKIRFEAKESHDAAEVFYVNEARYTVEWLGAEAQEKPITYTITPTVTNLPGNVIWIGFEAHNLSTGELVMDFPNVEQHVLSPAIDYDFKLPSLKFWIDIDSHELIQHYSVRCQVRAGQQVEGESSAQSSRSNAQELGESTEDIYIPVGGSNAIMN
jgi:hypothetical protein